MNLRVTARLLGLLMIGFAGMMATALVLALVDEFSLQAGADSGLSALLKGMGVGLSLGVLLLIASKGASHEIFRREALAVVSLGWVCAALVGALPFYFSGYPELATFTDCYFESMSGLTGTGSSILTDIEALPKALLFWRAIIQWIGGMGIVVLFVALLPLLGVGGRALFKSEVPGPVSDAVTPRIKQTAVVLWQIYFALTILQIIALALCGMSVFEATCHAFTAMATGGYSTRNASIAAFNSLSIEIVLITFMILASTNFSLYYQALRNGWRIGWRVFLQDTEFRVYLSILLLSSLFLAANQWLTLSGVGPGKALRDGAFTTVSIMSTTGYVTADYDTWSPVAQFLLILLMFFGGCGGSTACGIKVIRLILLFQTARFILRRTFSPNTVFRIRTGNHQVSERVQLEVLGYFFLLAAIYLAAVLGVLFQLPAAMDTQGHSAIVTAISAVATTINGVGPGLDFVGPTRNFAALPAGVKWILSLCMLIGRLEILAVAVLFVPSFWRRR